MVAFRPAPLLWTIFHDGIPRYSSIYAGVTDANWSKTRERLLSGFVHKFSNRYRRRQFKNQDLIDAMAEVNMTDAVIPAQELTEWHLAYDDGDFIISNSKARLLISDSEGARLMREATMIGGRLEGQWLPVLYGGSYITLIKAGGAEHRVLTGELTITTPGMDALQPYTIFRHKKNTAIFLGKTIREMKLSCTRPDDTTLNITLSGEDHTYDENKYLFLHKLHDDYCVSTNSLKYAIKDYWQRVKTSGGQKQVSTYSIKRELLNSLKHVTMPLNECPTLTDITHIIPLDIKDHAHFTEGLAEWVANAIYGFMNNQPAVGGERTSSIIMPVDRAKIGEKLMFSIIPDDARVHDYPHTFYNHNGQIIFQFRSREVDIDVGETTLTLRNIHVRRSNAGSASRPRTGVGVPIAHIVPPLPV